MDDKEKKAKAEREYREYVESFAEAMKEVEDGYKRQKKYGLCYKELKRNGWWEAEFISGQYVLIVGKMSNLSARLRDYITKLGALAYRKHLAKHPKEKKGDTDDAPRQ